MRIYEVQKIFGLTGYAFHKKTGMHHCSYKNWRRKGFIPIKTQMQLELLSNGVLKARLEDLAPSFDLDII